MTKLPEDTIKYGKETTHGTDDPRRYEDIKEVIRNCYSALPETERQKMIADLTVEFPSTISFVEIPYETTRDQEPIWKWVTGEITGGYTHEIVKPEPGDWIITDAGARKLNFNHEATFTWELTEEDSRRWRELMEDIGNKVTVTWDGHKFLCTYEYDEETGILHLEGEEIEDE